MLGYSYNFVPLLYRIPCRQVPTAGHRVHMREVGDDFSPPVVYMVPFLTMGTSQ